MDPMNYCGMHFGPEPFDHRALEVPAIEMVALLLEDDSLSNGLGDVIDPCQTIRDYQQQLLELVPYIRDHNRPPDGFELFVPDFWHISHGRAKMLTGEDGTNLHNSSTFGIKLGERYFRRRAHGAVPNNYPGSLFSNP
jgi:hypothetical protein